LNTFYDLKKAYEREIEWCFGFGGRNLNNETIWKKNQIVFFLVFLVSLKLKISMVFATV